MFGGKLEREKKKYPRRVGVPFYFQTFCLEFQLNVHAHGTKKILFSFRVIGDVRAEEELTQKFINLNQLKLNKNVF